MKKRIVGLTLCVVLLAGCTATPHKAVVRFGEGTDTVTAIVEGEKLEAFAESLDDAGIVFTVETIEAVESGAGKAESALKGAGKVAAIGAAATGNPIAASAALILTSLGGLAGAVGGFFRERKKRKETEKALAITKSDRDTYEYELCHSEKALSVVLDSVDDVKFIGAKITTAAREKGCADRVEAVYQRIKDYK